MTHENDKPIQPSQLKLLASLFIQAGQRDEFIERYSEFQGMTVWQASQEINRLRGLPFEDVDEVLHEAARAAAQGAPAETKAKERVEAEPVLT